MEVLSAFTVLPFAHPPLALYMDVVHLLTWRVFVVFFATFRYVLIISASAHEVLGDKEATPGAGGRRFHTRRCSAVGAW